jgi:hypothetical protein
MHANHTLYIGIMIIKKNLEESGGLKIPEFAFPDAPGSL